eukprot:scaffold16801_cov73-Skeletonema_marinoi.AAC.3
MCNYLDSYDINQYNTLSIGMHPRNLLGVHPRSYHDRGGRLQFVRHKDTEEPSLKRRARSEA